MATAPHPLPMSSLDKKRKGSKAPARTTVTTSSSKKHNQRTSRHDEPGVLHGELFHASSPAHHLSTFQPPSSSNVVNIEHGVELDKLSSKLFGIPLSSGTNFALRIHPGSDPHIPLVVKDTIDWLAHYGTHPKPLLELGLR